MCYEKLTFIHASSNKFDHLTFYSAKCSQLYCVIKLITIPMETIFYLSLLLLERFDTLAKKLSSIREVMVDQKS